MLSKFQSLPADERRALVQGAFRLTVTRLFMFAGIATAAKWLGRDTPDGDQYFDQLLWEVRATALQRLTSRLPATACLARALSLRWWMRSQGFPAIMKIGVKKEKNELKSHAWVEIKGRPIGETVDSMDSFVVINSY